MVSIIIYTLPHCPACDRLKKEFAGRGLVFEERNMSTVDSLAELRFNGVFTTAAPVLQVADEFYTSKELFNENGLNREIIKRLEVSNYGIHD
jgi:glutaredoxin